MKDVLLSNRYRIESKLGRGSYGSVWQGTDMVTGDKVAIKFSDRGDISTKTGFRREVATYKALGADRRRRRATPPGFPRLHHAASLRRAGLDAIVIDLLGPDIQTLVRHCTEDRVLSVRTVVMLARQAVRRLWTMHNRGQLHLDVKPSNMMMGRGRDGNTLYFADFGLVHTVGDPGTALHRQAHPELYRPPPHQTPVRGGEACPFIGTDWFASVNMHKCRGYTYADDIESLAYSMLFLLDKELPWARLSEHNEPSPDNSSAMSFNKEEITPEALFGGYPAEFAKFLHHARSTPWGERPNYAYLLRLLDAIWRKNKYKSNTIWDWQVHRHRQILQESNMPVPDYSCVL